MVKIVLYHKTIYAIIGVFVSLLLIGVGVYAYGGVAPATMGHTVGEFMPSCTGIVSGTANTANSWTCASANIPVCTGSTQGISWTGSLWSCRSFS